ncbi:PorP/SprF family type IX secretion system membrane protein [Saccharicrinis fermentans]|uniref:Bacteroidetes-specific putative membrane protein n=1 Tax=Saccharicrinis fermentans DSM 9555 = JCM 21142 TaxID=869213 RepID=W7Y5N3_9BACT|nr:type IX secretion system membrane protein PorP/SprF [Saccharicrinis fermentans]GAF03447.1 bacteroidetes-specific putative membrane protein [Saccharicrinis fermentans DSM 9555 = JCM 21142]
MFRRILIFVIFCAVAESVEAQYDPQFSQNMFNKLAVNPGFAGATGDVNLVALNRNQWTGNLAIKTTVFSGDMRVKFFNLNSGIGLNFINDEIGNFTNLTMNLNYALKFEMEKGTLSFGINFGLLNQSLKALWTLDAVEGDYYNANDPNVPTSDVNGSTFDAGIGVYYKEKKYYLGASLSHLNSPKANFKEEFNFKTSGTFYLLGGYNYKIEDTSYEWLPSFFYKTDGRSFQIDVNTLVRYKKRYWGGLSYRFQDAIVLLGGIEMKNGVRLGYSYDITTSAIASSGHGGTHELMVGYNLDINFDQRTKRYKSVRYL